MTSVNKLYNLIIKYLLHSSQKVPRFRNDQNQLIYFHLKYKVNINPVFIINNNDDVLLCTSKVQKKTVGWMKQMKYT